MTPRDYVLAYLFMGMAYTLPKVFGFLRFLNKSDDGLRDIPGPAWLISGIAAVITTCAALVIIVTWPFWMLNNLISRDK